MNKSARYAMPSRRSRATFGMFVRSPSASFAVAPWGHPATRSAKHALTALRFSTLARMDSRHDHPRSRLSAEPWDDSIGAAQRVSDLHAVRCARERQRELLG